MFFFFFSSRRRHTRYWRDWSSDVCSSDLGTSPSVSNFLPRWTSSVASPPSSRIMFGPSSPGQSSARSVHHQYSSRASPFQAKDRKSTRLNSSHANISYAVFCLKKKQQSTKYLVIRLALR